MQNGSEPGDFEHCPVEIVDVWERITISAPNSDIQSSRVQETSGVTLTEEVDAWKRVSDEAIRLMIVRRVLRLLDIWVICGLIVFIVYRDAWLLTTSGLLELLLHKISGYYFRRPKK